MPVFGAGMLGTSGMVVVMALDVRSCQPVSWSDQSTKLPAEPPTGSVLWFLR